MRHLRRRMSRQEDARRGHAACRPPSRSRGTSWLVGKRRAARDAASPTAEGGLEASLRADLQACTCTSHMLWRSGRLPSFHSLQSSTKKLFSIMGSLAIFFGKRSAAGSRTWGSSVWIYIPHSADFYCSNLCPLLFLKLDTIRIELTASTNRAFRYL